MLTKPGTGLKYTGRTVNTAFVRWIKEYFHIKNSHIIAAHRVWF